MVRKKNKNQLKKKIPGPKMTQHDPNPFSTEKDCLNAIYDWSRHGPGTICESYQAIFGVYFDDGEDNPEPDPLFFAALRRIAELNDPDSIAVCFQDGADQISDHYPPECQDIVKSGLLEKKWQALSNEDKMKVLDRHHSLHILHDIDQNFQNSIGEVLLNNGDDFFCRVLTHRRNMYDLIRTIHDIDFLYAIEKKIEQINDTDLIRATVSAYAQLDEWAPCISLARPEHRMMQRSYLFEEFIDRILQKLPPEVQAKCFVEDGPWKEPYPIDNPNFIPGMSETSKFGQEERIKMLVRWPNNIAKDFLNDECVERAKKLGYSYLIDEKIRQVIAAETSQATTLADHFNPESFAEQKIELIHRITGANNTAELEHILKQYQHLT